MTTTDLLGLVAGMLTTAAFIPQVVKTWRTRSTHDISLGMFALFNTGLVLWLVYGVMIDSLPIVVSNIITLALALTILVFKLRYK
ncbi:MAG: SemiSWEET transporter [Gammaproteobacteria bacterium]|nr:SemiSWEET transporter [Gammaproteobacteria bacterium]